MTRSNARLVPYRGPSPLTPSQEAPQPALLQAVIDSIGDLIFAKDVEGRFILANRALRDGCGQLVGSTAADRFAPEIACGYDATDKLVIKSGRPATVDAIIPIDGSGRLFNIVKLPWIIDGEIMGIVGVARDITEREAVATALKRSETLYRSILEASADSIAVLALDGTIELINARGRATMQASDAECAPGQTWIELWPHPVQSKMQAAILDAASGNVARLTAKRATAEAHCTWFDIVITPICDEDGLPSKLLAICRDVTSSRKSTERLRWASEHDGLTTLANRTGFQNRLQAAVLRSMHSGSSLGLLLFDLDHFKHVNDTLGHAAGDQLLQAIAQRLNHSLRVHDFAARLGGDEFALILEDVGDEETLRRAASSIAQRLNAPIAIGERTVGAGVSIGAALFPRDAATAHDLFNAAGTALYTQKNAGRGGLSMFDGSMRAQAQRTASQLNLARVALDRGSVLPHYQPKIDLGTSRLIGYEALLRWMHPSMGLQMPNTVQEAFRDYELAAKIGDLMRQRVIGDIRALLERGVPFGRIALNAAPAEFLRDDYAERLLDAVGAAGVSPELIEIEVTEHAFSERGTEYVARALNVLSRHGVSIALDDFGTGSSSLSHLRDFPVNVVKIDRSFVERMIEDEEISAIVTAVIGLGRSLSLQVVAEGIETEAQRQALLAKGCMAGQGYYYGRPMPFSVLASKKCQDWTSDAVPGPLPRTGASRP